MHLFNVIWEGLLTGMALSLMLGTVFFALLKNSIQYGHKTGFFIAAGVVVCDILFISLALLSDSFAKFLTKYQTAISVGGGIVLIVMGAIMIIKAKPKLEEGKLMEFDNNSPWVYFLNGFFLNLLNPVNFFSWLAISTMLTIRFAYTLNDKVYFFGASLVSIFFVEVLVAFGASKIKRWITADIFKRINQISGLIFIGLGLKLAAVVVGY